VIALIRHADAGDRNAWRRDDRDRPLTALGRRQAEELPGVLSEASWSRVLSSPYLRCRETVEPLARSLGVPLEDEALLGEGAPADRAMELLADLAGRDVALCSHGDVIGGILRRLAAAGIVAVSELQLPKASAWLLEQREAALVSARYLPPPAV
jgi:phosphohistidine phosphatase SixA